MSSNLELRLKRLENRHSELSPYDDIRILEKALSRLSDEDFYALDEFLDEALESGEKSDSTCVNLYEIGSARVRRALDAYAEALEALMRGE